MNTKLYNPIRRSRCLIIGHQKLWRTALSVALEAACSEITVETTNFHRTIIKTCVKIEPDIVLLDICPEREGYEREGHERKGYEKKGYEKKGYAVELATKLHRKLGCQIIFMDQQIALSRVEEVLKARIGGYYTRDCSFQSLLEGLRQATSGEITFCPELMPHLVSSTKGNGLELEVKRQGTQLEVLTQREFEVLHHLAEGMNVRECANHLQISRKTVDVHKTRIMSKLEVHNHNSLVAVFENSQLFELPSCS